VCERWTIANQLEPASGPRWGSIADKPTAIPTLYSFSLSQCAVILNAVKDLQLLLGIANERYFRIADNTGASGAPGRLGE